MPLPRPVTSARVLEPTGVFARKADDDEIGPAIAVQIGRVVHERFAVMHRIELIGLLAKLMYFPIGGGEVHTAGGNIELAIVIKIANAATLAAKLIVELHALKMN